jgi:hypothetical protein
MKNCWCLIAPVDSPQTTAEVDGAFERKMAVVPFGPITNNRQSRSTYHPPSYPQIEAHLVACEAGIDFASEPDPAAIVVEIPPALGVEPEQGSRDDDPRLNGLTGFPAWVRGVAGP